MKQTKITKAARGQPCSLRLLGCNFDPETTVYAHIRLPGDGMGMKPPNGRGCFACSSCHDLIDGRRQDNNIMEKEILWRKLCGWGETFDYLVKHDLIVLK